MSRVEIVHGGRQEGKTLGEIEILYVRKHGSRYSDIRHLLSVESGYDLTALKAMQKAFDRDDISSAAALASVYKIVRLYSQARLSCELTCSLLGGALSCKHCGSHPYPWTPNSVGEVLSDWCGECVSPRLESPSPACRYVGDGKARVFPYPFRISIEQEVVVEGVPASEYQVAGVGDDGGGDVIFKTPPLEGCAVNIVKAR